MFKPKQVPTYYWNNLKKGNYTFRFFDINNAEFVKIKEKYDNYFKYLVEYIDSNLPFFDMEKGDKMFLLLPIRCWEIALHTYPYQKKLRNMDDNAEPYVNFHKFSKKKMKIQEISVIEQEEEPEKIEEEIIM